MSKYVTQVLHLANGDSFEAEIDIVSKNLEGVYQFLLDIICQAYYNKA